MSAAPGFPAPPVPDGPALIARLAGVLGTTVALGLGWLALGQAPPPARPALPPGSAATAPAGDLAVATGRPCGAAGQGYVRGRLFGALALEADWTGPELLCDGGVRPGEAGVRLFFAYPVEGARVVLMIGIDAAPAELTDGERPANVTVIDERNGRFFSSGGAGRCWVDELRRGPAGGDGQWLTGRLYCAGAIPSLADRSSLTLGDIRFSGRFAVDGG